MNQIVNFRICDLYHPDPAKITMDLYSKNVLQGRVIAVSDSGEAECAFVAVEVEGVEDQLIVPADRILSVL